MKTFFSKYTIFLFCIYILSSCAILSPKNKQNFIEIEFYSIGAGIDFKAKKLLEEFIVKFNEENNTNITYTSTKHGKEGETNFTFDITQLSKNQKSKFSSSITEQLKTAKNCTITEN